MDHSAKRDNSCINYFFRENTKTITSHFTEQEATSGKHWCQHIIVSTLDYMIKNSTDYQKSTDYSLHSLL